MVLSSFRIKTVYIFLLINIYSYLLTPKKIGYNFDKILHIFLLILGVGK